MSRFREALQVPNVAYIKVPVDLDMELVRCSTNNLPAVTITANQCMSREKDDSLSRKGMVLG